MTNDLLDIDVRLLVLRHGRVNVLQALARTGDQTLEDLERQLQALGERKAAKTKHARPSILELAAAQAQDHPDYAEPLRTLALGYDNRTFLPQLRDVQRFLDHSDTKHGKLKSRVDAAPLVIRTLAKLPLDELNKLIAAEKAGNDSDYALLARAIMGTPSKPPDPAESK